jgi:hypothetical protein
MTAYSFPIDCRIRSRRHELSILAITVILFAVFLATPLKAAERHHHAHEHGVSTLKIAVEGPLVEMRLVSPGMDIVGFEHAPSTDTDRQAVAKAGAPVPGLRMDADRVRRMDLQPRAITAFFVGLKSRFATFAVQRKINEYRPEPLLAILPGVALQELWSLMATAERALSAISVFVVATGLIGMMTMLLSGMNERRREMAILRAVGARPAHIFSLFLLEAGFIAALGAMTGLGLLYILLGIAQPLIESTYGLFIAIGAPTQTDMMYLGAVVAAGVLAGLVPAIRAVRLSLADGIIVRS